MKTLKINLPLSIWKRYHMPYGCGANMDGYARHH